MDTHAHATIDFEQMLSDAGIRITAVRLLVLKTVNNLSGAFSLQDVTGALPTADPSSVFRALTLFAEHDLLDLIDDGTGMQKYCLCHCGDPEHCHGHIHFTCTRCRRTMCLYDVPIPQMRLPEGFEIEESEFIIKGLCPDCVAKK